KLAHTCSSAETRDARSGSKELRCCGSGGSGRGVVVVAVVAIKIRV
ncbi:hypothetical protein Tco_0050749, partial [Tanacetum coccineum]